MEVKGGKCERYNDCEYWENNGNCKGCSYQDYFKDDDEAAKKWYYKKIKSMAFDISSKRKSSGGRTEYALIACEILLEAHNHEENFPELERMKNEPKIVFNYNNEKISYKIKHDGAFYTKKSKIPIFIEYKGYGTDTTG